MGQKPGVQTRIETRLAAWRVFRGVTQQEMADAIGISLATYRRLERGGLARAPVGYLVNAAIALGCDDLDSLFGGELRRWTVFDQERAPVPPDPQRFWREQRRGAPPELSPSDVA